MINKNLLYILPFTLLSCCQHKSENNLKVINEISDIKQISNNEIIEINNIVEAIINQYDLDIIKSNKNSDDLLLENLNKIHINKSVDSTNELYVPAEPGSLYITDLVNQKFDNEIFFTSEDSIYIIQQNTFPDKIKITTSILEIVNTENNVKEKLNLDPNLRFGKYEISIPIFSKDMQTAYVQLDYFCGSLCGNGTILILKKINGNWIIIKNIHHWIS